MVKTIFFGTPEIACASLSALAGSNFAKVISVVSQPDRPSGRELKLRATPVKALATKLGIPVLQPERARDDDFLNQLRALEPAVIVVMAYGQILPAALLQIPKHGCVNIHTSLLPKYRGAAPIQRAILNGDTETGVTLMKMDPGMDTGPIVATKTTPIFPTDTAETLHDRLGILGSKLLIEKLPLYLEGKLEPMAQPEGATLAKKISKEEGRLDWRQPAQVLSNKVRGLTPWPGAFTFLPAEPKPILLKVWKAEATDRNGPPGEILEANKDGIIIACGQGSLRLLEVQREGAKRMPSRDFLGGSPLNAGQRLE